MFKTLRVFLSVLVVSAFSASSQAHFQMLYTAELLRDKGGEVVLKMPFTHPAANGHVMAVGTPKNFFHTRKGKTRTITESLVKSNWTSAENTGISYEASVRLKGLGDNVFVLEMAPYLQPSEGIYIQQFAKTIVNVGGLPTDWSTDLSLAAEIVPLTKPYAIYEGGSFTGVVKSLGTAVPFAEIEVEFANYAPDVNANKFSAQALITPPAEAFITMTMLADANGTFTFTIPKAGHWGFAALGVGPAKEFKGKELSQDAVIWVQAHAIELAR